MQQQEDRNLLEKQLVFTIQENLALYLYDNAIFLAERLVAEFPCEQNIYLLATCYHRAGQTYRAYHLLKGLQGTQSRYLFAVCCLQMDKHSEAESALLPDNDISRVPNGAAGCYLLGRVFQLSNRHSIAQAYYQRALKLDPTMWCAFEELCNLGEDSSTQEYVKGSSDHALGVGNGHNNNNNIATNATPPSALKPTGTGPTPGGFTFNTHTPPDQITGAPGSIQQTPTLAAKTFSLHHQPQQQQQQQPTSMDFTGGATPMDQGDYTTPDAADMPSGPPPMAPRGGGGGGGAAWPPSEGGVPLTGGSPSVLAGQGQSTFQWTTGGGGGGNMPQQRKFLDEGKMRKISSKLFADPASVLRHGLPGSAVPASTINAAAIIRTSTAVQLEETAAMVSNAAVSGVPRGERSLEGIAAAVALLQLLGEGYRLLSMYRCQEAVDAFTRLPPNHLHTGWALMQLGRTYFEMVDYNSAALAFEQARKIDPYRLKGIEVYSTVLWHMKREVELSALANEAIALDRQSPQAWCVMGNCFSLQKEHESSLKFFQRAVQLDETLPYANTLCGHEYLASEDFEKAITCYRSAMKIDPRHYNAWFGMGHIYYRQEKYGMAEYHFRRAQGINDRSSVLRCYLGMSLHKLKRNAEALQVLSEAIAMDPRNPLARFERANVLQADGKLEDALMELRALHDVIPTEATVLFHMGKVFKKLGRVPDALAAFNEALDLQPPAADTNQIKSAIDKVTLPDTEEEDDI